MIIGHSRSADYFQAMSLVDSGKSSVLFAYNIRKSQLPGKSLGATCSGQTANIDEDLINSRNKRAKSNKALASDGNIRRYEQVLRGIRALPRHVSVLATSSLFQHFVTGADGVLTGFANFAPEFCVNLFDAVKQGNLDEARRPHEINWALEAAIYKAPNVYKHSRYKVAAYFAVLMDNMLVRPPQVPVPEGDIKPIHDAMQRLGMVRRNQRRDALRIGPRRGCYRLCDGPPRVS